MNIKSRSTQILIAVGVLILCTAAYFLLMNRPSDGATVLVSDGSAASEAQTIFIGLAAQLDPVSFDTSILSDPRFLGLQDIHTTVVPEAAGRVDPFASLSGTKAR